MRLRHLACGAVGGVVLAALPLAVPVTAAHADCATLDVKYTTTGTWTTLTPWATGYCITPTPLSAASHPDAGGKLGNDGVDLTTTVLTP
jgi:hypothetical protein